MEQYYSENLFYNCLESPAREYNKLRVLTGYASSSFILDFIERYPQIELEVMIGMARQGIDLNDHWNYCKLTEENPKVKVYYQIEVPMTHIKLYQWYSSQIPRKSFVGSANFSENGFKYHNELLLQSDVSFNDLLNEFLGKMLLCTNEEIAKHISFIDQNQDLEEKEDLLDDLNQHEVESDIQEVIPTQKVNLDSTINHKLNLKRQVMKENLESLSISLYERKQITLNVWMKKNQNRSQSFLLNPSPKKSKQLFFPKEHSFNVVTDDEFQFECITGGDFGKQILIKEGQGLDFYSYIKDRLKISEDRLLEKKDFDNYGTMEIMFYKRSETEYYMDFSPR